MVIFLGSILYRSVALWVIVRMNVNVYYVLYQKGSEKNWQD